MYRCFVAGFFSFTGRIYNRHRAIGFAVVMKRTFGQSGNFGLQTGRSQVHDGLVIKFTGSSLINNSCASVEKNFFPADESIPVVIPNTREMTLLTFPSSTAYGRLKAKEEMAEAV